MSGMSDGELLGDQPTVSLTPSSTNVAAAAAAEPSTTNVSSVTQDQINAAADDAGVDRDLFGRLIHQESGGRIGLTSPKGALGPAQLMPATAKALGVDPGDPVQNLQGGAKYLKSLLDQFGGDPTKAAAAYNAGPDAVIKYGGVPPFPETQAYVANVVGASPAAGLSDEDQAAWDSLHGPQSPGYGGSGYGGTGQPSRNAPAAQANAYKFLDLHGFRDASTPLGSSSNPYGLTPQADASALPNGSWYVGLDGKLQVKGDTQGTDDYLPTLQEAANRQKQVAAEPLLQRAAETGGQGLLDIGGSLNKFTGGGMGAGTPVADETGLVPYDDEAIAARQSLASVDAARNKFDVEHATDPIALPGRLAGQVLAAGPLMATGEGVVGAASDLLGDAVPATQSTLKLLGGGGGGGVPGVLARVPANAAQGAGYAALNSSTSDRPLGEQMATGAAANTALGLAGPAFGGALDKITGGVGGKTVSAPVAALADQATNKFGIPLRTSQILGVESRPMATTDSNMISSSSKFAANNDAQQSAFTRAVSRTFGADSSALTPEVMSQARSDLGAKFDAFAANHNITDTDALQTRLGAIIHDAQQSMPDSEVSPLLRQVQNIGTTIENGQISGKAYQALTRTGTPLDRAMQSSDSNVRYYAGQIKDALDDGMAANASPEDIADFRNTRLQYKNLMTVKGLASGAGVSGTISPAKLPAVVNRSFSDNAFTGAGDLGTLAKIGQTFMKEPPNSHTTDRFMDVIKRNAPAFGMGGSALGGGVATYMHNPPLALGALATGAGIAGTKFALDLARERALGARGAQQLLLRSNPAGPPVVNRFLLPSPVSPITPLLTNQFMNSPAAQ